MKNKINLRLSLLMVLFGIVLIIFQSYSTREVGIHTAITKAKAVAEVVKSGLTAHMVNGNMDQRDIFIESISKTKNIEQIWLIRGQNVIKQYGNSVKNDSVKDSIDKEVLQSGKLKYIVKDNLTNATLRVTIPYKASDHGNINCLQCHSVKTGDTLGAVSIEFDISDIKEAGLSNILIIIMITLFATIIIIVMMSKMLKPYLDTLDILNQRIDSASNGLFKEINLDKNLPKETKDLVSNYNNLTRNLMDTFKEIDIKLKSFVGKNESQSASSNPLAESKDIITKLSHIYQFKNLIQLDKDKTEIYKRFGDILKNQFNIKYVNILEIDDKSKVEKVYQHGKLDYCSSKIFESPENCRVSRNANDVCFTEYQQACPCFESKDYLYYCMDNEIGKSSKIIFNFIFENKEEFELFKINLPFVKSYIKEISPEIESKILFQALEDSSLKDGLTGLYNRRFLDEHLKTLIPQVNREKRNIGMLMLDMDHFKAVNDEYGHDIGDRVLQEFARVVKENVRESDIVVRYGGEEFVVLLVDVKNEEDALNVANKIREKVAENEVDVYAGSTMRKTISIGLSMYPQDSKLFTTVMKYADLALYEAKDSGRNQVRRYKENPADALELF